MRYELTEYTVKFDDEEMIIIMRPLMGKDELNFAIKVRPYFSSINTKKITEKQLENVSAEIAPIFCDYFDKCAHNLKGFAFNGAKIDKDTPLKVLEEYGIEKWTDVIPYSVKLNIMSRITNNMGMPEIKKK